MGVYTHVEKASGTNTLDIWLLFFLIFFQGDRALLKSITVLSLNATVPSLTLTNSNFNSIFIPVMGRTVSKIDKDVMLIKIYFQSKVYFYFQ